jgi:hypothetical protein
VWMLDLKPRGESYDPDPKMEENLRQAFVPQDAKVCQGVARLGPMMSMMSMMLMAYDDLRSHTLRLKV